jgi:hypothetical protein
MCGNVGVTGNDMQCREGEKKLGLKIGGYFLCVFSIYWVSHIQKRVWMCGNVGVTGNDMQCREGEKKIGQKLGAIFCVFSRFIGFRSFKSGFGCAEM